MINEMIIIYIIQITVSDTCVEYKYVYLRQAQSSLIIWVDKKIRSVSDGVKKTACIILLLLSTYTLFSSTYLSVFKSFRNVNIPLPPLIIIYDIYYVVSRDDDVFIVIVIYNIIYTIYNMMQRRH